MATVRQKKAVEAMVGTGGNVTKAMLEAGYSPNTANTPQKLTESDGYRELMDAYLPDDMLLRALADDIEKKVGNRKAELELGFKIKGKLSDKVEHSNPDGNLKTIIINKYGGSDTPTT